MKNSIHFLTVLVALMLSGCSAALVPYTSDPAKKVGYANALAANGRNIPAARLLKEVQETTPTDVPGLLLRGQSHVLYIDLINGKINGRNKVGFQEIVEGNSQDVDTHRQLALKDYQTAKAMVETGDDNAGSYAGGKNFALSNIAFRVAQLYLQKGDIKLACDSLDESLRYNEIATKEHPTAKVEMNSHFQSYAEMITANKKAISCPATGN